MRGAGRWEGGGIVHREKAQERPALGYVADENVLRLRTVPRESESTEERERK